MDIGYEYEVQINVSSPEEVISVISSDGVVQCSWLGSSFELRIPLTNTASLILKKTGYLPTSLTVSCKDFLDARDSLARGLVRGYGPSNSDVADHLLLADLELRISSGLGSDLDLRAASWLHARSAAHERVR